MNRSGPMETVSQAIERLAGAGYRESFRVEGEAVVADTAERSFRPEDLVCERIERFEGESDPADQAILLVLRDRDSGLRGTLVAAFGPEGDPQVAEVVRAIPTDRATDRAPGRSPHLP